MATLPPVQQAVQPDDPAVAAAAAEHQAPSPSVRVVVRPRMLFEEERSASQLCVNPRSIDFFARDAPQLNAPYDHEYQFDDGVFRLDTPPHDIYEQNVSELVWHVARLGESATVACYGQTGSGKSYTMGSGSADQRGRAVGLLALAVRDIVSLLNSVGPPPTWSIQLQCVEVYQGEIMDLLNDEKERLHVKYDTDGSPVIPLVTNHEVKTASAAEQLFLSACARRITQSTEKNATSSRSHALFMLRVQLPVLDFSQPAKVGHMTFVDLAGTEGHGGPAEQRRRHLVERGDHDQPKLECAAQVR